MIYLVRHGETLWNQLGRQQGRLDSPLSDRGRNQARAVGQRLRQLLADSEDVMIQCSPLGRAVATAEIICVELGVPTSRIVASPLLAEYDWGNWQGLTFAEVRERYPDAWRLREADKWNYAVERGESYSRVSDRARKWLQDRPAGPTIVITHEMLSRTIQGAYASLSERETLGRSHGHRCIYCLHEGRITEVVIASSADQAGE